MMDSEHVWTPLLVTPTALIERRGSHLVWEAWTDVGSVGVGRTAVLTQIDNFRQGTAHPRLDPTRRTQTLPCRGTPPAGYTHYP
jgi:hypothetical protein